MKPFTTWFITRVTISQDFPTFRGQLKAEEVFARRDESTAGQSDFSFSFTAHREGTIYKDILFSVQDC